MEKITGDCIIRLRELVDELIKKGATPPQLMVALTEATVYASFKENDPLKVVAHLDSVVEILSRASKGMRERAVKLN